MKKIVDKIRGAFPITSETYQNKDLTFVTVAKDQAVSLITHLRDYEGFSHLVILTAVDWLENGVFQLTYLLNNPVKKVDLGVRVEISRENATMQTIHQLWAGAATYQRELKEMYGIDFPNSPRVDEPFILEGWNNIPPNRRDFDSKKYSEETFFPRPGRETNDPAEYMKKKLYPEG